MQKLQSKDIEQLRDMQDELEVLRTQHWKINTKFLDQIEERNIIFVEDGTDLGRLNIGASEGFEQSAIEARRQEEIFWKKLPIQAKININKYLAKYSFEIARKLSG